MYAARLDVRFVGRLVGRMAITSRSEVPILSPTVVHCTALSLSAVVVVVEAAPAVSVGDTLAAVFEQVGTIRCKVTETRGGGFQAIITDDLETRTKLAATINWLKKKTLREASDLRDGYRRRPLTSTAYLYTEAGETEVFIVDVSSTGALISSTTRPPLGATVSVGKINGRVVRHADLGFAITFYEMADLARLNADLTARL